MKARTMVYLDSEQLCALQAEAKAQRISLAELMRRLVEKHIEERHRPPAPPSKAYFKIIALGSSGRKDVADRHDQYLGEALSDEHAR
ncbi:MAG: ribbon-helix-helix protein, CopG family [Deltaproteobacteria bacterium]|nr:ribbon-helix-helix protein, CopG family [Deltaproteobacteria bacterium]